MNPVLIQLKCKSCQGDLDPNSAVGGVIVCKFCGNTFTLPRSESNDVIDSLRDAERELDRGHFESAFQTYQRVSQESENEPEAYFGMAIANAKVQYLNSLREDEETGEPKKCLQPICYDIVDKKFTEDRNYKKALELATPDQKKVYIEKGKEIDDIRKKFNELKNSGVSYDCFICTKVSEIDNKNRHTEDCYDAEQLYSSIKEAGYNPFFSEKVLKKGLGVDYEAYILYALYSSPCMIIVCNDEAYLRTPWVQNEYTRFLQMIKNEEKHLNSITFAFKNGHIIEKLPGVNGKIQGVAIDSFGAKDQIIDFVSRFSEARNRIPDISRKEYGQINAAKKNVIEQQIKKRDLKIEKRGTVTASDQSNIDTIQNFLDNSDFNTASSLAKNLLKQNPKLSAAHWLLGLADSKCKDTDEFISNKNKITSFENIENAISTESDEKKRKVYYDALYERVKEHKHLNEYEEYISLPESDSKKIEELSDIMYDKALTQKDEKTFTTVLKTVTNTDKYIKMNKEFLNAVPKVSQLCYNNILEVDKSDNEALYETFVNKHLSDKKPLPEFLKDDEKFGVLEKEVYSFGFNDYATDLIFKQVIDLLKKEEDDQACKIFDFVLKMIPKNKDKLFVDYLQEFIDNLLGIAGKKRKANFDRASSYNELLLQTDKHNYDACFNRFLIKHRINNLLELVELFEIMRQDEDYLSAITQFNESHPEKRKENKYVLLLNLIEKTYTPLFANPEELKDCIENLCPTKEDIFDFTEQIKTEINLYKKREKNKADDKHKKDVKELKDKIQGLYGELCKKYKLKDENRVFSIRKNISKDPILQEIKEEAKKLEKLGDKDELKKIEDILSRQARSARANVKAAFCRFISVIILILTFAVSAVYFFLPICSFLGYNNAFLIVSVGIFKNNLFLLVYMIFGVGLVVVNCLLAADLKRVDGFVLLLLYFIPLIVGGTFVGLSYVYKNKTTTVYCDSQIVAKMKQRDEGSYALSSLVTLKDFNGELTLPETYNNLPVTVVGKKFHRGIRTKKINKLIVSNSYTTIDEKAFCGNDRIYEIVVGDGVTQIFDLAFYKCKNLTTLTIGDGVTSIPYKKTGAFGMSKYMFKKCKNLTTVYFGTGITEIGDCAFYQNPSIREVHYSSSITSIGQDAFYGCTNLSKIYYAGNSEEFDGIYIAKNVAVSYGAFAESGVERVYIEDCDSEDEINVGTGAFRNCVKLTYVYIGKGITTIGDDAFSGCTALSEVILNVTRIGNRAFKDTTSLTSITIPTSVKYIYGDAFKNSGLLTAKFESPKNWYYGTNSSYILARQVGDLSDEGVAAQELKDCGEGMNRR